LTKPEIKVGVKYPAERILEFWKDGRLRDVTLRGYVARSNGDGTCSFEPWWKATDAFNEHRGMRQHKAPMTVEEQRAEIEREHPIVRRTPQQRVAAMVLRIMGDAKKHGGIPGLTQEQIRTIVGEYWKAGDPVTEELVRRVAAYYLSVAEKDNREADSHRVTRQHPTA